MASASFPVATRRRLIPVLMVGLAAAVAAAYWLLGRPHDDARVGVTAEHAAISPQPEIAGDRAPTATTITFPRASWTAAAIELRPATVAALEQVTTLTGKITLNEDRVAHIYPLVEGRVDEVNVGLGDAVKRGQQMAVIQSREVGQAMLQLAQDRLQLCFAQR